MAPPRNALPDATQVELETALTDVRRALWTVRSHVVLVAPAEMCAALCKALVMEAGRPGRTIVLELAGREGGLAEQLVVKAINRTLSGGDTSESLPARTPGIGEEATSRLARAGASLVVLLPRADQVPAPTLRRLGQLATSSQKALRLALCVDGEGAEAGDAAGALVRALGVGAEKIVRGEAQRSARDRLSEASVEATMHAGPPRLEAELSARRVRPVRVRSRSRSRRGSLPLLALLGVAAVAWTLAGRPLPRALPFALEPSPEAVARAAPPESPASAVEDAKQSQEEPEAAEPEAHAMPVSIEAPTKAEPERSAEPTREIAAPSERLRPREPEATPLAVADAYPAAPAPVTPVAAPRAEPEELPTVESAAADVEVPEPATVAVSLNAQPWARIDVDGHDVGPTPIADLPLAPGEHRVRATFPSGRVVERVLRVDDVHNHFRID